jgi:outer membrane protein assembly factor BamE (lipoprotein component of BamABCDE complex)
MRLSWIKVFVLVAIGLGTQVGCVTRGDQFSSDYSWLEKDETTKDAVVQRLGQPFLVGYSGGSPTWTYGFYKFRLIGESHTKELTVYWNDDDTVETFTFKSSFPEDRSRILMTPKSKQAR